MRFNAKQRRPDQHRQVSSGCVCGRRRSEEGFGSSTLGSSQAAEAVRTNCLDKIDLRASMDLAQELITAGIEGLVFPSVVGGEDNLIVYCANCGRKALSLQNEREVIDQVRRISGRHK